MKKTIFIVLLALVIVFAGCSISFTTANITNAAMTSGIEEGVPVDSVKGYTQDTEKFYASCVLNNAPDDTIVRFVWSYVTEPQVLDEIEINNEGQSGIYLFSSYPTQGLPTGEYSVEIYVDDREDPDATIGFTLQ